MPSSQSAQGRFYDPEVLAALRQRIGSTLAARPAPVPELKTLYEQRLPMYRELLGDTRDTSQAQMLFDIAQRAFGYAANLDERGRPMTGGALSRLAGAFQGLPATIGARIAEIEKGERAIKTSALSAAEKEVENIKRMNQQIESSREKLIGQLSGQAVRETADERRERLAREGLTLQEKLSTAQEEGRNLRNSLALLSKEREGAENRAARARDLETRLAGQLEQAQLSARSKEDIAQQQATARAQLAEADRNFRTALSDARIGAQERMQAERLKQAAEAQVQRLDAQMAQLTLTIEGRKELEERRIAARAELESA
jgi:chromosome segregation ATPase